ncbi:MAG TPA: hypothetical protein VNX67_05820 [Solirubrobacteraceae bacterium]|nr:hypothetical protein [Solirubrobacteraceae bacterium]
MSTNPVRRSLAIATRDVEAVREAVAALEPSPPPVSRTSGVCG